MSKKVKYTLEYLQSVTEGNDKSSDMDVCHLLCFLYNVVLIYSIKDTEIDQTLQKICEKIID